MKYQLPKTIIAGLLLSLMSACATQQHVEKFQASNIGIVSVLCEPHFAMAGEKIHCQFSVVKSPEPAIKSLSYSIQVTTMAAIQRISEDVGFISSGRMGSASFTIRFPSPGQYPIGVVLDPDHKLSKQVQGNRKSQTTVSVGARSGEKLFVKILSPSKGERWRLGDTHTIRWETNAARVRPTLRQHNNHAPAFPQMAGSPGQFVWRIEPYQRTGDNFTLAVIPIDDKGQEAPQYQAESDFFSIDPPDELDFSSYTVAFTEAPPLVTEAPTHENLLIDYFGCMSDEPIQGHPLHCSVRIQKNSGLNVISVPYIVYASTHARIRLDEPELKFQNSHSQALANFSVLFPQAGNVTLMAVVDPYNRLRESSKSDNRTEKTFRVYAPPPLDAHIELLSPKGNNVWRVGTRVAIRWKTNAPRVGISVMKDGTSVDGIISIPGHLGEWFWDIPQGIPAGSGYVIRVGVISAEGRTWMKEASSPDPIRIER